MISETTQLLNPDFWRCSGSKQRKHRSKQVETPVPGRLQGMLGGRAAVPIRIRALYSHMSHRKCKASKGLSEDQYEYECLVDFPLDFRS